MVGATSPLCHHNNDQHASSYLPIPPPHLKGSNVPSSVSAWRDPRGSQPQVCVPRGLRVSKGGASCKSSAASCPEGQFKGRVETVPPQMQNGQSPDGYIFAFAMIPSCRFNLPLFLAEVMVPSITSALLDDILEVTLITSPCSSSLKDRVEELKPLGWKE